METPPAPAHASLREIARRAGVSMGTVSRALRNKEGVSDQTRKLIVDIAQHLGYDVAKLRRKRIRRIAFMLYYQNAIAINEAFYSRVRQGAEEACRTKGMALYLSVVGPGQSATERLRAHSCDAAICAGFFEPEILKGLQAAGLPVVLVDMRLHGFSSVSPDNRLGAYRAVRHLLDTGRTRVGMIAGSPSHYSTLERVRGYRLAMYEAGILANPCYEAGMADDLDTEAGARFAMQALLDLPEPPDAVFCDNDIAALSAMRTCISAGLKVPQDISIAGFDDIPEAMLGHRPLTTVHIDTNTLGALAVDLLLKSNQSAPIEKTMPAELIVRASTTQEKRHWG